MDACERRGEPEGDRVACSPLEAELNKPGMPLRDLVKLMESYGQLLGLGIVRVKRDKPSRIAEPPRPALARATKELGRETLEHNKRSKTRQDNPKQIDLLTILCRDLWVLSRLYRALRYSSSPLNSH